MGCEVNMEVRSPSGSNPDTHCVLIPTHSALTAVFKIWPLFSFLLAVRLGINYLLSLCLSFFIWKMEMVTERDGCEDSINIVKALHSVSCVVSMCYPLAVMLVFRSVLAHVL